MTVERSLGEKEKPVGRKVAEILLDCGCLEIRNFKFASGIISPMKIEIDKLRANPEKHREVSQHLANLAKAQFPEHNVLVAVPNGGISLVKEMYQGGVILPRVRPVTKNPEGSFGQSMNAAFPEDARVVVVEDVVTTGGSASKTVADVRYEIRKKKSKSVLGVVCLFSYGFPHNKVEEQNKLPIHSLCTFEDLIDAASARPEYKWAVNQLKAWHASVRRGI